MVPSRLGGCTSRNALIWVTAHDSDWDNIAAITGDGLREAETWLFRDRISLDGHFLLFFFLPAENPRSWVSFILTLRQHERIHLLWIIILLPWMNHGVVRLSQSQVTSCEEIIEYPHLHTNAGPPGSSNLDRPWPRPAIAACSWRPRIRAYCRNREEQAT